MCFPECNDVRCHVNNIIVCGCVPVSLFIMAYMDVSSLYSVVFHGDHVPGHNDCVLSGVD